MPTNAWYARVKLYGINLDLESLTRTNHNGFNDAAIRTLSATRRDLLNELAAALPSSPAPALRVSLFYREKTVRAIVASLAEANALFARWADRHPGAGMIARNLD